MVIYYFNGVYRHFTYDYFSRVIDAGRVFASNEAYWIVPGSH